MPPQHEGNTMDAVIERSSPDLELKDAAPTDSSNTIIKPTREEAEEAVRTLIKWAGDDPTREGLIDTPRRVTKAYGEFFKGYTEKPEDVLSTTFEEVEGYSDMVVLRDIRFESHCEHHMVPIIGKIHIAYMPNGRVVGISKLARVIEIYAKRLQVQEKMTAQIADAVERELDAKGVAVIVDASHHCMTMRGVRKHDTMTITRAMRGCFQDERIERQFWDIVKG